MRTVTQRYGVAATIAAFSLFAILPSAFAYPEQGAPQIEEPGHGGNDHDRMPHQPPFHPMPPALYQASLQTNDPVAGVNKLVSNVPAGNGKTYEVSVSIREVPPAPPAPQKGAAGKEAR
ncbi:MULTISPECIES: hypothetical protein [Lonsdalea]|uniref:Uncharacterized protein n=2 Tax=Lonsdalea TaxID=1082702 RepID=A0ACD1J971_9GAMM|nr:MULTISPECIES: hypothetical protein [Lonsdalea]OSM95619.1 hypothetical protein AU508_11070 [Lonsdalea populi]OSM96704.1 hypothetical protein AU499_14285 [Lonsdalea populi]QPQ23419.1 hypothetical protein I6N93_12315 [Lonsdalea populi]RAT11284.1 hypothetical protein AU485_14795 [Lonsdalea quercina]RAT17887.1 hypothetical protein AU486_02945 [Lonsdalea quercina]